MSVSFDGIGETVVTFLSSSDSPAVAGQPVKLSANGAVAACADGDRFFGVALSVEDGAATVRTRGFVTLAYSGDTAPAVGFAHLLADGSGKVKPDAGTASDFTDSESESVTLTRYTGGEYAVISVDTTNKKVGFFL